ncbi:hypothetical protein HDU97_009201 [Phlyctochytrium planicorne]|nr:hypothetical protein HDU97_009201 [Phlyctochytrium planicorne]
MASITKWLWRKEDDNYEKILSDLDEKISKQEIRMAEIQIKERHILVVWLYYSIPIYTFYLIGYFTFLKAEDDNLNVWLLKTVPLLLIPFLIYYGRKFIVVWFRAKKKIEAQLLENLRTQQKQKVEELKKKTGYYTTKGLIERYESPTKPDPNMLAVPGSGQRGPLSINTPQSQNQLRQRHASMPSPPTSAAFEKPGPEGPNSPLPGGPQATTPLSQPGSPSLTQFGTPNSGKKYWYDKVVEAIIGEEGPQQKYALICQQCFEHNGLVLPEDYATAKFRCMKCGFFNTRKSRLVSSSMQDLSGMDVSPPPSPMPGMARTPSQESFGRPQSRSSSREPTRLREEVFAQQDFQEQEISQEIAPAAAPAPSEKQDPNMDPYDFGAAKAEE